MVFSKLNLFSPLFLQTHPRPVIRSLEVSFIPSIAQDFLSLICIRFLQRHCETNIFIDYFNSALQLLHANPLKIYALLVTHGTSAVELKTFHRKIKNYFYSMVSHHFTQVFAFSGRSDNIYLDQARLIEKKTIWLLHK